MAKLFRVSIDLGQNELLNARLQHLASAPASPVTGQVWFNTATGKIEFRGESAVIDPTDRAHHTGSQPASTISDFDAAARSAVGGAALAMGGNRITGLADGQTATDAATVGQLAAVQNGIDWKQSVRAATTANLAALSGLLTVDGVTLVAGDRILVKNQTTASGNGVYVAATGAWTRAPDAVQGQLTSGATVMVTEGTVNGNAQWQLTTDDPITVGTTAQTWAQIGAGTSYTAPAGGGVIIAGSALSVDTAVVVRKYAAAVGGATSVAVTHNLNTRDVTVGVYDAATFEEIECDVVRTSVNVVTLGFAVAPAASSLRCVVHG